MFVKYSSNDSHVLLLRGMLRKEGSSRVYRHPAITRGKYQSSKCSSLKTSQIFFFVVKSLLHHWQQGSLQWKAVLIWHDTLSKEQTSLLTGMKTIKKNSTTSSSELSAVSWIFIQPSAHSSSPSCYGSHEDLGPNLTVIKQRSGQFASPSLVHIEVTFIYMISFTSFNLFT